MTQTETVKTDDVKTEQQLNNKYETDNPTPPPYDTLHFFIADPQNISEKVKQVENRTK